MFWEFFNQTSFKFLKFILYIYVFYYVFFNKIHILDGNNCWSQALYKNKVIVTVLKKNLNELFFMIVDP